jgi:hypothetical protein
MKKHPRVYSHPGPAKAAIGNTPRPPDSVLGINERKGVESRAGAEGDISALLEEW